MDNNSIQFIEQAIRISAAALAPITAIFAVAIAFNQYRLSRHKLKLDLFEKRYSVYREAIDLIRQIIRDGRPLMESMTKYSNHTEDAIFLFDQDINNYLDELWKKACKMHELHEKLYPGGGNNGLPVGTERSQVSKEEEALLLFFAHQHSDRICAKKFAKYLSFHRLN